MTDEAIQFMFKQWGKSYFGKGFATLHTEELEAAYIAGYEKGFTKPIPPSNEILRSDQDPRTHTKTATSIILSALRDDGVCSVSKLCECHLFSTDLVIEGIWKLYQENKITFNKYFEVELLNET